MNRKTVVFLISDFLSQGYEKALQIANKRHDVVAITITDPREMQLPRLGFIQLEDAETGENILIDTYDGGVRDWFREYAEDVGGSKDSLIFCFCLLPISFSLLINVDVNAMFTRISVN